MMVFDSYRLLNGLVVGLTLHEERFYSNAVEAGARSEDVWEFLRGVRAELPRTGEYFPKVSYSNGHYELEVRPCPPLRQETTLALKEEPGERAFPLLKGPDMAVLSRAREAAVAQGAHDALLVRDGWALEAANAALLVWTTEGPVAAPDNEVLPSVTLEQSARRGLLPSLQRRAISTDEALASPCWVGSALHGWTPVTRWILPSGEIRTAQNASWGEEVRGGVPHGADQQRKPTYHRVNAALWEWAEGLNGPYSDADSED